MDLKNWLSFVNEEYKEVRQESVDAEKNAQSTLKYGITVIGVIFTTGLNLWNKEIIPEFAFLVLIPILTYLILTIYIGEFARRVRAGQFIIQEIEAKLNEKFKDLPPAINFESWIRSVNKNGVSRLFKWNRYATIILLLFIAISSIIIGNYKILLNDITNYKILLVINIGEAIILLLTVIFNYLMGKNLN